MKEKRTPEEKKLEKAQQKLDQARAELELATAGNQILKPELTKDKRVNVGPFSWSFFLFVL